MEKKIVMIKKGVASAIMPLDRDSQENIKDMTLKTKFKGKMEIIDDDVGKGRFIK